MKQLFGLASQDDRSRDTIPVSPEGVDRRFIPALAAPYKGLMLDTWPATDQFSEALTKGWNCSGRRLVERNKKVAEIEVRIAG